MVFARVSHFSSHFFFFVWCISLPSVDAWRLLMAFHRRALINITLHHSRDSANMTSFVLMSVYIFRRGRYLHCFLSSIGRMFVIIWTSTESSSWQTWPDNKLMSRLQDSFQKIFYFSTMVLMSITTLIKTYMEDQIEPFFFFFYWE